MMRSFLSTCLIGGMKYLAIYRYGIDHDSALDAIRHLYTQGVHPPLFQLILDYWVDWFGKAVGRSSTL